MTSTEDRLIKHKDIHSFSHHENLWKKKSNISRQWIHILPLKTSKETIAYHIKAFRSRTEDKYVDIKRVNLEIIYLKSDSIITNFLNK